MTRLKIQETTKIALITIKNGKNKGREAIVLDILGSEDESPCILIRSLDLKPFIDGGNTNRRFKLTGWRELDIAH